MNRFGLFEHRLRARMVVSSRPDSIPTELPPLDPNGYLAWCWRMEGEEDPPTWEQYHRLFRRVLGWKPEHTRRRLVQEAAAYRALIRAHRIWWR